MCKCMGGVVAAAWGYRCLSRGAAAPPSISDPLNGGHPSGVSSLLRRERGPWKPHHRCLHPTESPPPFLHGGLSDHDPFDSAFALLRVHVRSVFQCVPLFFVDFRIKDAAQEDGGFHTFTYIC